MTSMSAAKPLNTHHKAISYRPDIDGLRAIAVLSVVGFHAFPEWIKGGFIGVDIFFVISGFLISSIIMRELKSGSFSFADFYQRRVDRIFPALLTMLIALFAFGWFTLYADEFMQLGKHTAGGAGFIANFILLGEDGYFDNSSDLKPLLHLWSLGIEEQFYILWPLILWASYKLRINLIITIVCLLGISFYLNIENIDIHPTNTFYSPQTRFWELLSGAALAFYANSSRHTEKAGFKVSIISSILSISGLVLFAYGFLSITKDSAFPGWQAVIPVIGAVLIILAGRESWINQKILSNKLIVWIGLISFPLYLWHWPLLSLARTINGGEPSQEFRGYLVVLAIALSAATYRLIETPLKRFKSWKKTTILLIFMLGIGGSGYAVFVDSGVTTRANIKQTENINSQFVGALWKYTKNETCLNKYPYPESNKFKWWFCMANSESSPSVLILGNSYANQLYPGMANNPDLSHNSILSIGTCDPAISFQAVSKAVTPESPCSNDRPARQQEFIDSIIQKPPR